VIRATRFPPGARSYRVTRSSGWPGDIVSLCG
jgi:hypothetical protein